MFDFWKFYQGLFSRTDFLDDYWDQFPEGRLLRFKKETLSLLKATLSEKKEDRLANIIDIIYSDGADSDYTDTLIALLDEHWHIDHENIVSILELIKDPKSIDKLYEAAVNVPEYDDMRALAKKCIRALSTINTPEAVEKLKVLCNSNDSIIKENAMFVLGHLLKKK
jgi:HEAT repeat protein